MTSRLLPLLVYISTVSACYQNYSDVFVCDMSEQCMLEEPAAAPRSLLPSVPVASSVAPSEPESTATATDAFRDPGCDFIRKWLGVTWSDEKVFAVVQRLMLVTFLLNLLSVVFVDVMSNGPLSRLLGLADYEVHELAPQPELNDKKVIPLKRVRCAAPTKKMNQPVPTKLRLRHTVDKNEADC